MATEHQAAQEVAVPKNFGQYLRNLGPGYVVWDKAGEIEFVSPGRGAVTASFELTQDVLDELRTAADGGAKVLRWFSTDIVADDGTVVARVRKQLYVREKRPGTR